MYTVYLVVTASHSKDTNFIISTELIFANIGWEVPSSHYIDLKLFEV